MARFISSIGQITGKLGGVVFKRRGNKTYISKAPARIKPTNDPATKQRRKKFAWVGKFTGAVNASPLLNALWKPCSSKSSPVFGNIFKSVYGTINPDDLSGTPLFTPGQSFSLKDKSVLFGMSSIFVEVDPLGFNLGIDLAKEISFVAAGVMILSDPKDQSFPEDLFLPVQSGKLPLTLTGNSNFIIPIGNRDIAYYGYYRTKKAYIVLITLDVSGNPVHYSEIIS
jgi:hypothetical protein